MSIQASQLIAKVGTEGVESAKAQLKDVGATTTSVGGIMKNALAGGLSFASGLAGQALGFLKDQLVDGVRSAIDHQAIMEQTAKVLKSTADASGMTQQSLEGLASSLEKTTYFSKDQTEEGENLLLTFTGIGKDVFPLATKTLLDMSKAMGQDVKSSAIQLGKALNDPAQGMTALTRVGVTFTEQQKQQIQQMTAAGNVAGAQKIMLAELQREFGGSADATGSFAGRLTILKDRFNDIKERVGEALLPVLGNLLDHLVSPALDEGEKLFHKLGEATQYVGNVLKTVNLSSFNEAWKDTSTLLRDIETRISKGVSPVLRLLKTDADPVADAIQKFAQGGLDIASKLLWGFETALLEIDKAMSGAKGPVTDFANGLKPWIDPLKNIVNLLSGQFKDALRFAGEEAKQIGGWFQSSVVPALKDALPGFLNLAHTILDTVIPALIKIRGIAQEVAEHAFKTFLPIIEKVIPPLIRFAGVLANDIANGLKFIMPYVLQAAKAIGDFAMGLMDRIAPIIKGVIDGISNDIQIFAAIWNAIWPALSVVLKLVWGEIQGVIQVAWAIVTGIINVGLDILSGNWSQAWTDIQNMFVGIWDGIKTYFSAAWDFIKTVFAPVGDFFSGIGQGIWNGIKWGIDAVITGINGLIGDLDAVQIHIPAVGVGPIHTPAFDWNGMNIGKIPMLASGGLIGASGWALVGERGPEPVYLPQGARVFPNSQLSQMQQPQSQASNQPIILVMDGRTFARGYMPYHVEAVRNKVGVKF